MRVNLSDLAAKGARPEGYLLNTAWTPAVDDAWIAAFAGALAEEQARYGIALSGGDTVSTPGPLTLTLTAFGSVAHGHALLRSDRSEEHTSELQSLMRISYAVFCLKKTKTINIQQDDNP